MHQRSKWSGSAVEASVLGRLLWVALGAAFFGVAIGSMLAMVPGLLLDLDHRQSTWVFYGCLAGPAVVFAVWGFREQFPRLRPKV